MCEVVQAMKKRVSLVDWLGTNEEESKQASLESSLVWKAAPSTIRCGGRWITLKPLKSDKTIERVGVSMDGTNAAVSTSETFFGHTYYFAKHDGEWRLAADSVDWEF